MSQSSKTKNHLVFLMFLVGVGFALSRSCFAQPSADFPFEVKEVDVSGYFTEANLQFDPLNNPSGIFKSADDDTSTISDAVARQELVTLNESGVPSNISYIDIGNPEAPPIVFFHGLPTSKYLWRNVVPLLGDQARIIAFDQIGMGESSKHESLTYTFKQHLAHTEAFFDAIGLSGQDLTIVNHDSGARSVFLTRLDTQNKSRAWLSLRQSLGRSLRLM